MKIKNVTHAARATLIDYTEYSNLGDANDRSLSIVFDNNYQCFYFDEDHSNEEIKEVLTAAIDYMLENRGE